MSTTTTNPAIITATRRELTDLIKSELSRIKSLTTTHHKSSMKIAVTLTHTDAARILFEAGQPIPRIPAGCNTISRHFVTADGLPALVVNQTGFTPTQSDNEEECNGCAVAIVLDPVPQSEAVAALEQWLQSMLAS